MSESSIPPEAILALRDDVANALSAKSTDLRLRAIALRVQADGLDAEADAADTEAAIRIAAYNEVLRIGGVTAPQVSVSRTSKRSADDPPLRARTNGTMGQGQLRRIITETVARLPFGYTRRTLVETVAELPEVTSTLKSINQTVANMLAKSPPELVMRGNIVTLPANAARAADAEAQPPSTENVGP